MIELYIDGSCTKNPYGTGVAGALFVDKDIVEGRTKHLGSGENMSNNVAEYEGLRLGLEMCLERDIVSHIRVYSDSKLLLKQMVGKWRIKSDKIYTDVARNIRQFYLEHFDHDTITWTWIKGECNPADGLTRPPFKPMTKNIWAMEKRWNLT